MPFVRKPDCDAVSIESPQLFDEAVIEFFRPFASQKCNDLLAPIHEFRAISPSRIRGVPENYSFRVSSIPEILRTPNFQFCGFTSEWRKRWPGPCNTRGWPFPLLRHRWQAADSGAKGPKPHDQMKLHDLRWVELCAIPVQLASPGYTKNRVGILRATDRLRRSGSDRSKARLVKESRMVRRP